MSARPLADGRINLQQQRKRAKELLQRLKQGQADDQLALLAARKLDAGPTLADAQFLIARELGFASWPKLKAHVDAIAFAARNPGFEASDEARTTHWRCGNDIAHSLKLAGFKGTFRMLVDPLCMGPVQDLPEPEYRAQRNRYISEVFALPMAEVARRTDEEYDQLALLSSAPHSVLWCEADAYDQLFLIRALASLDQAPANLELIEVQHVPGVQRFIGIGQLAPDVLAWLWPQRRRIEAPAIALAKRAWRAYCAASPLALAELASESHAALPLLSPALQRQLQELPGSSDGLSLTERLALQCVAEAGAIDFGAAFAELMNQRDPLPCLGDLMFHALLRPLIDGAEPLLLEADPQLPWPKRSLSLTALGQRVLNGQAYWPDHASHERWVGGVCIRPRQPHWTLNRQGQPVWRER